MPRLPASLLRRASTIDPLLPLLLRSCRDLPSARNELRWLREHSKANNNGKSLYQMCMERSKNGKPLQYILGSQPFGELDILCKSGVLIPRHETEAYTINLARLILRNLSTVPFHGSPNHLPQLRILDLCTGTGCIPLLLQSLLSAYIPRLSLLGIDISRKAISLAKENLSWNIAHGLLQPIAREQITFIEDDILSKTFTLEDSWDILISNPPYISPQGFKRDTSHSVKQFEPINALIPPLTKADLERIPDREQGDIFYPKLLNIAAQVSAKLLLFEVDGPDQASRIAARARQTRIWDGCEIWKDNPEDPARSTTIFTDVDGDGEDDFRVGSIGEGRDRAVVCWRGEGQGWLGRCNESLFLLEESI